MYEHSGAQPADSTTPADPTALRDHPTGPRHSLFRRTVLRRVLPAIAAAGIGVAGFAGFAHAGEGSRTTAAHGRSAAAADFPTWGIRWVVHASADINSPAVGMINKTAPGQDRITADYQVDTGHTVCEGSACSTFMAHLTGPVTGFLSVVAVDIPQDRLPGVPVQDGGGQPQPDGSREEMLHRAAVWLTASNGAQVPYSQAKVWKDGYRQDCSGYASMALGLPTPGTNTVGLATDRRITRPISLGELKPGDLAAAQLSGLAPAACRGPALTPAVTDLELLRPA
ncbi:hypothetical protein [Streptomyces inhibens]|uniref:hypothetical protein n=1 Tax=Streptomyces inhibens TaxID=2293571 RepID=UPI001EE69398|nr:hypothetical protein [Streptomyces inhibens]UKY51366.1 hypothetical protein KI385_22840 [Streptomyces inhibens]